MASLAEITRSGEPWVNGCKGAYKVYMAVHKMYIGVYKVYMRVHKVYMTVNKMYIGV